MGDVGVLPLGQRPAETLLKKPVVFGATDMTRHIAP